MAPPLATQPIALDALLHLLYSRVLKTLGALGSKLVIQLLFIQLFSQSFICCYSFIRYIVITYLLLNYELVYIINS